MPNKKWYDLQSGETLESFYVAKASRFLTERYYFIKYYFISNAENWRMQVVLQKESFDYAIDKLAIMHSLNLSESDKIALLIGGMAQQCREDYSFICQNSFYGNVPRRD